jgi:hypothetical protein
MLGKVEMPCWQLAVGLAIVGSGSGSFDYDFRHKATTLRGIA